MCQLKEMMFAGIYVGSFFEDHTWKPRDLLLMAFQFTEVNESWKMASYVLSLFPMFWNTLKNSIDVIDFRLIMLTRE